MGIVKKIKNVFNAKLQNHLQDERILYLLRRELLNEKTLNSSISGVSQQSYLNAELIVSLTTFGKRLHSVSTTIESIMQGSVKPNRIVLWLDKTPENMELPVTIKKQMARGLEVYYTDENIRSYTKLIPTLKMYPDAYIVTIDDDLIYDYNLIENLLRETKKWPNYIIANRVHQVLFDKNGELMPYKQWLWEKTQDSISARNFLTGVGGVLYPPHCFDSEIFNKEAYTSLSKYNDDIWFFAMAVKNGVLIKKADTPDPSGRMYLLNNDVQDVGLCQQNVNAVVSRNDSQLKAVFEKYNLYDVIEKLSQSYTKSNSYRN